MTPMEKFIEYIGPQLLKNHNTTYFLELEKMCILKSYKDGISEGRTNSNRNPDEYFKNIKNDTINYMDDNDLWNK